MSDTMQEMADREILRYAVQREMFCPASGKILDIKTAVLVMGENIKPRVMHNTVWDDMADEATVAMADLGLTPEVYDGRVLRMSVHPSALYPTFYTITEEWCGHPEIRHVVRRHGEIFVCSFATEREAEEFVGEITGRVVA